MASSSHHVHIPPATVTAAAQTVAQAMGDQQHYAVVGGAACVLLGSNRATSDVDFVVPRGETRAARALLKAHPDSFDVDKRTQHTTYLSEPPVGIEILTPPMLFNDDFSSSTPVIVVQGVRVLKPTLILNAKCNSVLGRSSSEKKDTDTFDILFLLKWCASNGVRPTSEEIPNATLDFVQYFIDLHGNAKLWAGIGFDFQRGIWTG